MDMDAGKQFLIEFIDCYKLSRSLWDMSCPEYTSRHTKSLAYQKLLAIMKNYKKDACLTDVKKKINTLRSNYRREAKRIQQSGLNKNHPLYTTNLWWFDRFTFLDMECSKLHRKESYPFAKPEEVFIDEITLNNQNDEEDGEHDDGIYNFDVKFEEQKSPRSFVEEQEAHNSEPMAKKAKLHEDTLSSMSNYDYNILPTTTTTTPTPTTMSMSTPSFDTVDHMCKAWAGNLREMNKTQRIIAERAISEIIFQGQMGVLTVDLIPRISANPELFTSMRIPANANSTQILDGAETSNDRNYRQSQREGKNCSPNGTPSSSSFSSVTSQNQLQHPNHRQSTLNNTGQKFDYGNSSGHTFATSHYL